MHIGDKGPEQTCLHRASVSRLNTLVIRFYAVIETLCERMWGEFSLVLLSQNESFVKLSPVPSEDVHFSCFQVLPRCCVLLSCAVVLLICCAAAVVVLLCTFLLLFCCCVLVCCVEMSAAVDGWWVLVHVVGA